METRKATPKKGRIKIGIITQEDIDKNTGFLGIKGKLLKALLLEKKKEKKL